MIIVGTRGITYTKDRGRFHCPQCNGETAYAKKRVRRFFTLYFIPVIPMDKVGEYIECGHCRGTFREEVLSHDPRDQHEQLHAAYQDVMLRVMVHMMLADGEIDDSEIEVIRAVYGKLSGTEIGADDVHAQIETIRAAEDRFHDDLAAMGLMLNDSGKEAVIRSACMVAAADGVFQEEEQDLLGEIADALEVTPAHLRGLLTEMAG